MDTPEALPLKAAVAPGDHPPLLQPESPSVVEVSLGKDLSESDVRDAWGSKGNNSAVGLVNSAFENNEYDTSPEAKARYAKDHEVSVDDDSVVVEMTRRESVKESLQVVKLAVDGIPVGDSTGVFKVMGPDGKPTGKKVRTYRVVKPIIDELKRMSQEKAQPKGDQDPEPTARAKRAQELLDILEPRLVRFPVPGGTEYFIEPNLQLAEQKKRRISALAAAQAVEQAFIQSGDNKSNYLFSNLAIYHNLLVTGKGDPELLISIVTNLSRECIRIHGSDTGFTDNPTLATALQDLETTNVNYYTQPGNDPLNKLAEDTLAGLGVPEKEVDVITQQINEGKIRMGELFTFMSSLSTQSPEAISAAITNASGGTLTREEARLTRWMFETKNLEVVTAKFSHNLGIEPGELKDIRKFLKTNTRTIARNAFPPNHEITREDIATVGSLINLTDEEIIAFTKNSKGINGTWIMALIMALPMLQGVLGTGIGGEKEEG